MKVDVAKKLRAHTEAEASQIDTATQLQILANGNEILINANTMGGGDHAVQSDLTIYLPRNASVNLATRNGDVTVAQRSGGVQVSDSHGDVTLTDIAGDVVLSLRSGNLRASKIDGNIAVNGRLDELDVSDIAGTVNVNADVMNSVTLARLAKATSYHSSRTDLEMAALPGELTLESGDLKGSRITGPVRLTTRSKDISLDDVSGDAHIENANGGLELKVSRPLGALQLSNRNADIRLVLPAQAAFRINATVRHGEIQSDFGSINVSSEHGDSNAAGSFGSGGPELQISNEHGDVQIRKS
jgi:DUF4097 and DUF4098 domain-containing protein YvlB